MACFCPYNGIITEMELISASFTHLFLIILLKIVKLTKPRRDANPRPPGPPAWPIVGNILSLGALPHQSLYKLRSKYGPLIWLQLGSTNALVVQSPKVAEQLFKNHDLPFSDRKVPDAFVAHNYNQGSLSVCRYGSSWRVLRRLVTLGLMTNKKISQSVVVRRKCIDKMIRFIEEEAEANREIEVSWYVFVMTFNLMGNLIFSKDLMDSNSREGSEFYEAMDLVMKWSGKPNLVDFFPSLRRFDPQRIRKNMEIDLGRTINTVEKLVMERIRDGKSTKVSGPNDFLDSLLEYESNGKGLHKISTHNIVILILEMFFGGIETASGTTEWVMAELLRSPESMKKVKEELNQVIGQNGKVEESDLDKLSYLQAVIKEMMRLHPIIPMLVPRNTIEETKFMGYVIPKDTLVFVNTWAIGRDADTWKDPLCFQPERFLGSNIDYKGQNFELLPFGSGRRICVGIPLASRLLHLAIASLLHCFDWEIDDNSPGGTDMEEKFGFTVTKLVPLKVVLKKKIITESD